MENLHDLRKALEAEKLKNQQLEEKLKMKSFENDMIVPST